MNSKSLLLRTGSGSIPAHLPARPSVCLSVHGNIRGSSSELEITRMGDRSFSELELRTGGNRDRHKIGAYYQQMLKSDSTNSLLLRNYAKYLHEVEGDTVKAEEYYGRAILASPGDGEVLSLYGKLIWETQRDESRARSYFTRALQAAPNDFMVLGSYAHFLWEAEEEKQWSREDEQIPIAAMVQT